MTTTPTQNSVPSESPIDLKFNAGKIDEYVTSMGWTYTDRFGQKHYTIEGNNYLAQQAMAAFGYVILTGKTFTTGATINNPNEVLLNTADGEYYKWTGSFASGPKVVPENSTPAGTGGIGPGAWIGVGDASLRAALAASTGSTLVGHEGHTVGQYLDGVGKMVFPGDDLKVALESADNGDTVIVSGDVTLNQSVVMQKAVSIKRANGGRILWNGASNNCIRYILPTKQTITTGVQFLQGQNSATFPTGHGLVVGDCLEAHSTSVRHTDLSGSQYTRSK